MARRPLSFVTMATVALETLKTEWRYLVRAIIRKQLRRTSEGRVKDSVEQVPAVSMIHSSISTTVDPALQRWLVKLEMDLRIPAILRPQKLCSIPDLE